jgi:uncharacterized protein YegP (UPF0339 family)
MTGKFEIYTDKAGEYKFRLKASNGRTILTSEGYKAKSGCTYDIGSVKKNAQNDSNYECKKTSSGKFRFNLKSTNSRVIGTSEPYVTQSARKIGIESVKYTAPRATVIEI